MDAKRNWFRHFSRAAGTCLLFCVLLASASAYAASVVLVGLFPGKAVVVINGQAPRTIPAGKKTDEGITLISTDSSSAIFEIDGKKQTLEIGQHFVPVGASAGATVALGADSQGHHWTVGQVNGKTIRFLVDTGATSIALPSAFARNAGIDYLKGQRGSVSTANGNAGAFRVKLDSVTVGDITLYQVDAVIMEGGLDTALLGMSFLSRTDMKRDGANLVLTKRF